MDVMKALDWKLNTITCSEMIFLILVKHFREQKTNRREDFERRARDLVESFRICIWFALKDNETQGASYLEMSIAIIISVFEICGAPEKAKMFCQWTNQNYLCDVLKVNLVWKLVFGFAIRNLFHPEDQSPLVISLFEKEGKDIIDMFTPPEPETTGLAVDCEIQVKEELENREEPDIKEDLSTNEVTPKKKGTIQPSSASILKKKQNKKLIEFKQLALTTAKKQSQEMEEEQEEGMMSPRFETKNSGSN